MRLSVLMAVHGRDDAGHFAAALDSLGGQSVMADEVVLVEDGPLPPALAAPIEARRAALNLVSVRNEASRGLAVALNRGLEACRGELVARMDADDVALPHRFEHQLARFADEPDLDLLGGLAIDIDGAGRRGALRTVPLAHEDIVAGLWRCPFIHPTVMARTAQLRAVGGYDERLIRRQDYELWFRCALGGLRLANLGEPVLLYRFTSATLRRQSVGDAYRQGRIGLRGSRALGLPVWKQLACFLPMVRALLPLPLRHAAYRLSRRALNRGV